MYQLSVGRQPAVPMLELKLAWMSALSVSRSSPANALARAIGMMVLGTGYCGPASALSGPARPRTPLLASQGVSGANCAEILISTLSCSVAPQTSAARLNTLSACSPLVVPGLPPTGATGVGSLKPTPGA